MIHYIRIENNRVLNCRSFSRHHFRHHAGRELAFSAGGFTFVEKCPILFTNVITDVGSLFVSEMLKRYFCK